MRKPRRKTDPDLLATIKRLPCLVRFQCDGPVDSAHIRSRGAGGPDEGWNVIPLCRKHHSEQHAFGWMKFMYRYLVVKTQLEYLGWYVEAGPDQLERMRHKKMGEVITPRGEK